MDPLRKCRAVSRCRRLFSKLHNFSGETPSVSDTKKLSLNQLNTCVLTGKLSFSGAKPLFGGLEAVVLPVPFFWVLSPGVCLSRGFERWRPVSTCLNCVPWKRFSLETLTYPVCVLTLTIAPVQVYLLLHIFPCTQLDIYVRVLRPFLSFRTQGSPWFSKKDRTIIRTKHCASLGTGTFNEIAAIDCSGCKVSL